MVKSYYLPTFTSAQIRDMLADEIYVGTDWGGKVSYGKYCRYHKGQYAPPKETKGKVQRGEANPREDWIKQDYPIEPIFDLNPPGAAGEDVKRTLDGVPLSLRFFADRQKIERTARRGLHGAGTVRVFQACLRYR